jgi:hypothetical protein
MAVWEVTARIRINAETSHEARADAEEGLGAEWDNVHITRAGVRYVPRKGDIVWVKRELVCSIHLDNYDRSGVLFDVPYRVVKASDSKVTELEFANRLQSGMAGRVLVWAYTLRPMTELDMGAADQTARGG